MENLKQYKYIVLVGILILGFAFYWFEYRPSRIIKKCSDISTDGLSDLAGKYIPGASQVTKEAKYKDCLRDNGLEK